jgi:hypothetical protein
MKAITIVLITAAVVGLGAFTAGYALGDTSKAPETPNPRKRKPVSKRKKNQRMKRKIVRMARDRVGVA